MAVNFKCSKLISENKVDVGASMANPSVSLSVCVCVCVCVFS
jgi:hypothetical protein